MEIEGRSRPPAPASKQNLDVLWCKNSRPLINYPASTCHSIHPAEHTGFFHIGLVFSCRMNTSLIEVNNNKIIQCEIRINHNFPYPINFGFSHLYVTSNNMANSCYCVKVSKQDIIIFLCSRNNKFFYNLILLHKSMQTKNITLL